MAIAIISRGGSIGHRAGWAQRTGCLMKREGGFDDRRGIGEEWVRIGRDGGILRAS